jgi:hypothetical protein
MSRVRFPVGSLEFIDFVPSGRTVAQPVTEMSARNISCGGGGVKAAGV